MADQKHYLKFDATNYIDYLRQKAAEQSLAEGKTVSVTRYLQGLIEMDQYAETTKNRNVKMLRQIEALDEDQAKIIEALLKQFTK